MPLLAPYLSCPTKLKARKTMGNSYPSVPGLSGGYTDILKQPFRPSDFRTRYGISDGELLRRASDVTLMRAAEAVKQPGIRALRVPNIPRQAFGMVRMGLRGHPLGRMVDLAIELAEWGQFQPAQAGAVVWSAGPNWNAYICPAQLSSTPVCTSITTYSIVVGTSFSNCIGGQAVTCSGGGTSQVGFWKIDPTNVNRKEHVRSYRKVIGGASNPYPNFTVLPPVPAIYHPIPQIQGAPVWGDPIRFTDPNSDRGPDGPRASSRLRIAARGEAEGAFGGGRFDPPSDPPVSVRPGKGVKERKLMLSVGHTIAGKLMNAVTETLDVVNCVHKSLPRKFQATGHWDPSRYGGRGGWRASSPQEKLEAIYRHAFEIDLEKMVACLVMNQIQDYVIGRIGQVTAKANRVRGAFGGLALGPAL